MNAASKIVSKYQEKISACNCEISMLGSHIPIPIFEESLILSVCNEFILNATNMSIISITDDVIAVGDLYGDLHNLINIFVLYGFPPRTSYIFLGNIIEFGEYSLETLTLILAYKVMYPTRIHLLLGSTESIPLNIFHGLYSNIDEFYPPSKIYNKFLEVFKYFPIGAIVHGTIFCCQPETLTQYRSIFDIPSILISKMKSDDESAYNQMINSLNIKVTEEIISNFMGKSGMDYILLGNCPNEQYFHYIGGAMQISSSSNGFGAVVPMRYAKTNMIEAQDSQLKIISFVLLNLDKMLQVDVLLMFSISSRLEKFAFLPYLISDYFYKIFNLVKITEKMKHSYS